MVSSFTPLCGPWSPKGGRRSKISNSNCAENIQGHMTSFSIHAPRLGPLRGVNDTGRVSCLYLIWPSYHIPWGILFSSVKFKSHRLFGHIDICPFFLFTYGEQRVIASRQCPRSQQNLVSTPWGMVETSVYTILGRLSCQRILQPLTQSFPQGRVRSPDKRTC